jgi:hypothetical protein
MKTRELIYRTSPGLKENRVPVHFPDDTASMAMEKCGWKVGEDMEVEI